MKIEDHSSRLKLHQPEWFDAVNQLQYSNLIGEILHRHVTINQQKMEAVKSIGEDFKIQTYLVDDRH